MKISLEANALKLSSSKSDTGESEHTIETPCAGDPLVIGLNAGYLLDFIKTLGGIGEIRCSFKDGQTAAILSPEAENPELKLMMIVMPVRM